MKVLIIDGNEDRVQINLGLGFLLQYVRNYSKHKHTLKVFSLGFHNHDEILEQVAKYDLIGFSATSGQFPACISLAKKIKQHCKVPIVFGGIHSTSCPEEVMNYPEVDFICIGEEEISFTTLLAELENKTYNFSQISGLVYRNKDNPKLHNVLSSLPPKFISDLDIVGQPAWDLLEFDKSGDRNIISSRGCPFRCAHCYNSAMEFGFKYRRRSVNSIIEECIGLKKDGVKSLSFSDDLFLIDKKWISEFCIQYKAKVNLPFGCTARPEMVLSNEDSLKKLKDCGLKSIWIGIESGSKRIRGLILGRKMSNQVIINAFKIVRKLGISSKSYNMVGIPTEGFMDALATLLLNLRIKTNGKSYYTLIPYPGTKIHKMANDLHLFRIKKDIYNDKINVQSNVDIKLGALDTGKMNQYHIVGFRYLWSFVFFRFSRKRIFLRLKFLLKSIKFFTIGFYKAIFSDRLLEN